MKKWTEIIKDIKDINPKKIKMHRIKKNENTGKTYVENYTLMDLATSFDIETSSFYDLNGDKVGLTYIWMFAIEDTAYYGRTWEELKSFITIVKDGLNIYRNNVLYVYVHNLQYEYQFIKHYFEWENVFATDSRKVLYASSSDGLVFKCSYFLSGQKLSNTAKKITKTDIRKLEGDLDYDLIRTPITPLTDQEMAYCENDVLIITAYIREQGELEGGLEKLPLTKTGRVRNYCRKKCTKIEGKSNADKEVKNKTKKFHQLMKGLSLEEDEYYLLRRAYCGGFTHANAMHVGEVCKDVDSFDFTSSYPAVMVTEKYPMSKGFEVRVNSVREWEAIGETYCAISDVILYGVKTKFYPDQYISVSKCSDCLGVVSNNGRVVEAERIATTITNVDWEIIKQVYEIEAVFFTKCYTYEKNYLPRGMYESVRDLYQDKTKLKGVKGREADYNLSKENVNSLYGCTGTDPIKGSHTYESETDQWSFEAADVDSSIKKYNKSLNRFISYPWAVFITAYARKNLWSGILSIGEDYRYSDTDSIKLVNYEKHKDYFESYNKNIEAKLIKACEYFDDDADAFSPKTIKGVIKTLGVWDHETPGKLRYKKFKTLGAKRYLYETYNGELELTCAGVNKRAGGKALKKRKDPFEAFKDGLKFDREESGKLTHTYIDDNMSGVVIDYLGNEYRYNVLSSIHLEKAEYSLGLSEFMSFLNEVQKHGRYYI